MAETKSNFINVVNNNNHQVTSPSGLNNNLTSNLYRHAEGKMDASKSQENLNSKCNNAMSSGSSGSGNNNGNDGNNNYQNHVKQLIQEMSTEL